MMLKSELVLILFNVLPKLKHLWRQRGSRDPAAAGLEHSISAEGRPAADEEEKDAGAGIIVEVSRFLL